MRQSAIYGQRQFGVEDQGWLAWFAIAAVLDKPITIYGDGKQVRDMLDVRDLVRAYELAVDKRDEIAGEVFNIGGGPEQTISIWAECGPMLEEFIGRELPVSFDQTRPGDQRVYISDIRKAKNILGWTPEIGIVDGMAEFVNWVRSNRALFS
jgi:CDP-paratose 2-epimerase